MRALELTELILFSIFCVCFSSEPIGTGGPAIVTEGDDALLTCVVMNPYSNETVIWRKGPNEILSAGVNRVTADKRISILHDGSTKKKKSAQGGEVYVLLIKNVNPDDTDVYVCEVNSEPMLRSFHPLRVKPRPSNNNNNKKESTDNSSTTPVTQQADDTMPSVTHDFTECCDSLNVSLKCKGFCSVHNIIDGSTGVEPEACEKDFPSIVKCMADGRNHVPCCEKKKIPDICQDMCMGEYTPFTDYLKSRVSCVAHTLPGLQCILEGIQMIPSEPLYVSVLPLNERSIQVTWQAPERLSETVKNYRINVTKLHSFDEDKLATEDAVFSILVPGDLNNTTVNDLEPYSMYSITVMSENEHGSSLPSLRIRTLTLENSSGPKRLPSNSSTPEIPDVRGCCMKNGVEHRTCLDKMCDPVRADFTEVPDLMVCAPWANITFACLANNIDHSPCCRSRGIPDTCLDFCTGEVKSINFNYFKCLQYMSDYSTCLLEGYGVLPGAPLQLRATMVTHSFAVISWKEPNVLADTVNTYHLHFRKLGSGDEYVVVEKDHSPMILEDLDPTTYYEVFVVAVNIYGRGSPSSRLVFQTKHGYYVDSSPNYNMTSCCIASGVLPQCMVLCTYDIKMSDFQASGAVCHQQVSTLLRCAAGGRDHTDCCSRRGVPNNCLSICRGVVSNPSNDCLTYAGNIIQCLEEGTENIPGPVEDLRITAITKNSLSLSWAPNEANINNTEAQPTDYLVQYGKVDNMTMYETVIKLENEVNTTDTDIDLKNLVENAVYRIMVVARGMHGQSLPSSMLLVNVSGSEKESTVFGAPSPPHRLTVTGHSATSITIAWNPPEFSHPHEEISYQVIHKNRYNSSIITTRLQWARFSKLVPNTQHIIYVMAVGKMGTSLPSETLVAWTDPALPAFVEPPTIQPSDMIQEGGSMTVLCLALGNPAPTISLYIGGHLVRQDTSRHMVTTIHNITSDMKDVSCYADNGYGVPMQASKRISISYPPRLTPSGIQVASVGDNVELKCTVKANPKPKMLFWRDHDGRIPVIQGANFDMNMQDDENDPEQYMMSLKINKMDVQDAGDYFCHAENALGDATRAVSVRVRNIVSVKNITECCVQQNVSAPCMTACSFYIDVESVIDNPRCLSDFDKLMKCAADGSDHRGCCVQKNVPRKCLNWCRGEPVISNGICTLQYTKTIIGCFQENHDKLPGPPQNVVAEILEDSKAKVSWQPPMKNPHTIEGYRVFWYEVEESKDLGNYSNMIGSGGPGRVDTKGEEVTLEGLQHGVLYELVVKAGNHHGASILSQPIRFTLDDRLVSSASHSNHAGVIGGIFAGIIAIVLAIVALLLIKKRTLRQKTVNNNGVAFENPSYLREIHMDRVQITPVTVPASSSNSNHHNSNGISTSSNDWRQEELHAPASQIPAETEINPTLIEELKLGSSNAGFKKLVS